MTLARLQASDLELLREKRNSPEIREAMIYREEITPTMQAAWFASIDNATNHYSLVIFRGEAIGMAHAKEIDPITMSGEGGMIIWAPEHQTSLVPFLAAVAGTDWLFFDWGVRRLESRVLASNSRAIRYNRGLGYVFDRTERNGEVRVGHLTPEMYTRAVDPIRSILEAEAQRA